jgi:hypothetical protein
MRALTTWLQFCGQSILNLMSTPTPYQLPGSLTMAPAGYMGIPTPTSFGATDTDTGGRNTKHTMGDETNDHRAETETTGRFNGATPDSGTTPTTSGGDTTLRARRSPFRRRAQLVGAFA